MATETFADPRERLHLVEWRRRVSELYAQVRRQASADPQGAWRHWREVRLELYRHHPSSPVMPDRRAAFEGLYFDYDPRLRFELPVRPSRDPAVTRPDPAPATAARGPRSLGLGSLHGLALPISTGNPVTFERAGHLEIPFASGVRRLMLFWLPEYASGLFLPFRDASNGAETYGGGRYLLDTSKGADLGGNPGAGTVIVDFNFAYQPSCAFDPRWSCPLSPLENRLDIAVRAGERLH